MNSLHAVTVHEGETALDSSTLEEFDERLHGPLIRRDRENYHEARQVWNDMIDKHPALIARCTGTADVISAVRFAREHDLLIAVRGGGHNVAGHALCNGGLVIDLSQMRGVRTDPLDRTVRAQGGATLRDLDHETQAFGLATPGGIVSTTGIAGLTLGGGMGWLRRKYGLTCDNLLSADVVTADGDVVRASPEQHPDLFWALRGGGGNFGIVTSFEFQLHEVGPEVMFAVVMYPFHEASDLLPRWREFVAEAPDEVSAEALFWTVPEVDAFPEEVQGRAVLIIAALHCGEPQVGQEVLKPLRNLSEPLIDLSTVAPFEQVQTMFDPFFPEGGKRYYWKSLRLNRFGDDVIGRLIDHAADRPSPDTVVPIWHQGGAMNRVEADETAFGDRSAPYLLSVDSTWSDPANDDENIEWTRQVWRDMHQFSSGGLYLNFPGLSEEGEDLVHAAYGANYERLRKVKATYDPDNVFSLNENIRPKE